MGLSAATISTEVGAALGRGSQNEWEAVAGVTDSVVLPLINVYGFDAVLSELAGAKRDPNIAAILVELSGSLKHDPFRITEIYDDEEIVGAALTFLLAFPDAHLADGEWAWTALWNGWEQLTHEDHMRLLRQLIERVPWNDQLLWMIGDGPLSHAALDDEAVGEINSWTDIAPKIERIRRLVEVDWPHGKP